MTGLFRVVLVFALVGLFIASGSACKLGSDGNISITADSTPTSPPSSSTDSTPTPTPHQEALLRVTSSPSGALVEIDPQWGGRHYVHGTGKAVGSTPVEMPLRASELRADSDGCLTFVVLVGLPGYYSASDDVRACHSDGIYTFNPTLESCPADDLHCGGF